MKKLLVGLTLVMLSAAAMGINSNQGLERSVFIGKTPKMKLTAADCRIVISPKASPVVKYAAGELQHFMSEVLGGKVALATQAGSGCNIYVGATDAAAKQGFDTAKLARDGFYIKTVGKDIYILGRDDAKEKPELTIARGGYWSFDYERASLFGVYDFLERFCGVRFYFPGELGTIVPKKQLLEIPEINITEKPDMVRRFYYGWHDGEYFEGENRKQPKHPKKNLNMLRVRFGTYNLNCCHGINIFGLLQRFGKSNPEYFCLDSKGVRASNATGMHAGQMCWTSNVKEEVYKDIRAYFKGEPASSRGVIWNNRVQWGFPAFRGDYVDVFPQDSFQKCHCEKCKATYIDSEDYATELVWGNVIDWANRLKKENIKGKLSMAAYYPYTDIPKEDIPDNVEVQVCMRGPWISTPEQWENQKKLASDWKNKLGRKVHVWTYVNKHGTTRFPGVPACTPRAVGRFYKEIQPYAFGTFMEMSSDKFIYFATTYYIFGRVMWNANTDVDAVLDEYYNLMFGKAAPVMKKIMDDFEHTWIYKIAGKTVNTALGPVASVPSNHMLWNEIYSPEKIKSIAAEFDRAEKLVDAGSIESKRIALFRRDFLDPLSVEAAKYNAHTKAIRGLRLALPGKVNLRPHLNRKEKAPSGEVVKTAVNVKLNGDVLEIKYECEEPYMNEIAAIKRKHDDRDVWRDNCVEIFIAPGENTIKFYQIMINSLGSVSDLSHQVFGKNYVSDWSWDSGATAKVTPGARGFRVDVAIPLKNLEGVDKKSFTANLNRGRILKSSRRVHELYTWSPYISGYHDYSNYGWIIPGMKEVVYGGNFDNISKLNNKNWGIRQNNMFYGWIGKTLIPGQSGVELDRKEYFSAPQSMKLVSVKNTESVSQYIYHTRLKPNTTYRLRCVLKLKDVKPVTGGGGFVANLWDDSNHFFPRNRLTGTTDWVYWEFDHKTSANLKPDVPRVQFYLMNATGTAWIDDVSLEELPEK